MLARTYSLVLLSCECRAHHGFGSLRSFAVVIILAIPKCYEEFRGGRSLLPVSWKFFASSLQTCFQTLENMRHGGPGKHIKGTQPGTLRIFGRPCGIESVSRTHGGASDIIVLSF